MCESEGTSRLMIHVFSHKTKNWLDIKAETIQAGGLRCVKP